MDTKIVTLSGTFLVLSILLFSCGGSLSYDETEKTAPETQFSTSEKVISRLQLPEPGLDDDNLLQVQDYPEEGYLEIQVGPSDLRSEGHHIRYPMHLMQMPFDAWIHGFSWDIVNEQGESLPEHLLHHLNVIDPTHREWFSPISRRVLAAGRETGSQELPGIIGVPIEKDTPLLVAVMFASPEEHDYNDVYLRLRIPYSRSEDRLIDPVSVFPFYLDAVGFVGPKGFEVPAGTTRHEWAGKPIADGNVLGMSGHLHDYGKQITLTNLSEGETVWEVQPVTEREHHVVSVPRDNFFWQGGIELNKNHTYRISTLYYNPLEENSSHGGMGEIGGVFIPETTSDSLWKANADNKQYREDLKFMLSAHGPHEPHSAHH
ncbi:MAG: hypothetical protein GF372_09010 [Candidatus Marinimicrobia bacterium]|nr:hypothetical protein [Candidatus Neomarinimicrobiota bacterium]